MDYHALLLIGVQTVLALAAISLLHVSRNTSRAKYRRHEAYLPLALLVGVGACVVAFAFLYHAGETEDANFVLAAVAPLLTAVLCVIVVWRAFQALKFSKLRLRQRD